MGVVALGRKPRTINDHYEVGNHDLDAEEGFFNPLVWVCNFCEMKSSTTDYFYQNKCKSE